MANAQVTIEDFHLAVEAALREKFPMFRTVKAYPEDRTVLPMPALTFEISEMEHAPKHTAGDGRMPMDLRVEAHLIFSFKEEHMRRRIPALAANVAQFVNLQRWGLRCEPAEVIGCFEDAFDPELDQFVVWRVEWHQVVPLGESAWADDESFVPPHTVNIVERTPSVPFPADYPVPSAAPVVNQVLDPNLVAIQNNDLLNLLGEGAFQ